MISARFPVAALLLCCLFAPVVLRAQDAPPPVTMAKEFSAEMTLTRKNGSVTQQKVYSENGLIRSEMTTHGMPMWVILRPDQQKLYSIMDEEKMVMVMPYDPAKMKDEMALAAGLNGKYEKEGAETVNGVACVKYKYTSDTGKVYDVWVDPAKKIPVKMAATDQSFVMVLTDYKPGPQPAALFEPPPGYQVMTMPAIPNMPGGAPTDIDPTQF